MRERQGGIGGGRTKQVDVRTPSIDESQSAPVGYQPDLEIPLAPVPSREAPAGVEDSWAVGLARVRFLVDDPLLRSWAFRLVPSEVGVWKVQRESGNERSLLIEHLDRRAQSED